MPSTAAKLETLIVTKDELAEIAEWERKFAKAKKDQAAAEKQVKYLRIALAEKVLGVKTEDELKELTPIQVQNRFEKRLEAGDWKPERGAPEFEFVKTSSGSYPAWAQIFKAQMGTSAAARISAETPTTYSYAVEVSAS
jgi:hypothetical protein